METDTLQQARRLVVALAFSVFAVPRPDARHDGKTPASPWGEFQRRPPTDDQLVAMFGGAPMNIAIVTGEVSGIVVIDADSHDAVRWVTRRLPYTPWQTQTARGFHLFYRHPGVSVANRARLETRDGRLAIDVRGDGGYVIAPGSVHASGVEYQWAGDWNAPRADMPRFWSGWLQRKTAAIQARPPSRPPSGDLIDRARRYLSAIPPPMIGYGSDNATLYAACRLVRGFGLGAADASALLWAWAGGRPGWTREWIAAKVAHAERYGTEPIGALR